MKLLTDLLVKVFVTQAKRFQTENPHLFSILAFLLIMLLFAANHADQFFGSEILSSAWVRGAVDIVGMMLLALGFRDTDGDGVPDAMAVKAKSNGKAK